MVPKVNLGNAYLEAFKPKSVNLDYINMELTHLGSEASIYKWKTDW